MMGGWRVLAVGLGVVLVAGACSDGGDDVVGLAEEPAVVSSSTAVSTSTTGESTTSESTTTTLSEGELAAAEIEGLIVEWWTTAYDPSRGDDFGAPELLTGLFEARIREGQADGLEQGFIEVDDGGRFVDVVSVEVDLEAGAARVVTCTASDVVVLDRQTDEVLLADDPAFRFVSDWDVRLTSDGWRISNWFPSPLTDNPVECELQEVGS